MKQFTIIIASFFIFNFSFSQSIEDYINQVNIDSLIKTVRDLSGEDSVIINGTKQLIKDRAYEEGNELAAQYIKQRLSTYGLPVIEHTYSNVGKNIVATQTGAIYPDSIYIICAHYDGVNDYCADDNASGTAAVIETARILSKETPAFTILYALWDEEEIGLIGSSNYAQEAAEKGDKIAGVLNLEMFGYDSNNDGLFDIHSNNDSNSLNLANLMVSIVESQNLNITPIIYNPGTTASDHSSFWHEGYPAIMLIQAYYGGDFTPYYHSVDDRLDKFNMGYFYELSKLAIGTAASLTLPVPIATSTKLLANNAQLTTYPNPSSGIFNIEYKTGVNAEIINQYGMIVEKFTFTEQLQSINLSTYADGIYFVKIYDEKPIINKLIKQ